MSDLVTHSWPPWNEYIIYNNHSACYTPIVDLLYGSHVYLVKYSRGKSKMKHVIKWFYEIMALKLYGVKPPLSSQANVYVKWWYKFFWCDDSSRTTLFTIGIYNQMDMVEEDPISPYNIVLRLLKLLLGPCQGTCRLHEWIAVLEFQAT